MTRNAANPREVHRAPRLMEYPCRVDSKPCEVVACFGGRFAQHDGLEAVWLKEALDTVVSCLPCDRCREPDSAALSLARIRLGKHERNILLHSPAHDQPEGAILDPSLRTHAERETYLRAVRKLHRVGLIRVGNRPVRLETLGRRMDGSAVARVYAHRSLWITPFGAEIVSRYRIELERGRPIRWSRHVEVAARAVRLDPIELLARFESELLRLLHATPRSSEHVTLVLNVVRATRTVLDGRQRVPRPSTRARSPWRLRPPRP